MTHLCAEEIVQQLGQAGYRITRPRQAVIQVVLEAEGHSSPAQVQAEARHYCPTIGLVTVYRTLEILAEMGFVRRIHTDNGCHDYVVTSHGHLHHLVCRQCGAAVEVEGCDLSAFLSKVSRETGYRIEDHLLELSGLCANCQ
jgi:Fur family ferric uptake transcriptional regulator